MLSQFSELARQEGGEGSGGFCLLHLVLLGVAVAAYFLLRPKSEARRESGGAGGRSGGDDLLDISHKFQDPLFDVLPKGVNERLEPWTHEKPDYQHIQGV